MSGPDFHNDRRVMGKNGKGRDHYCCSTNEHAVYSDEEFEWLMAVEKYKKTHNRRFPTLCELLGVLHSLGYKKVAKHVDDVDCSK